MARHLFITDVVIDTAGNELPFITGNVYADEITGTATTDLLDSDGLTVITNLTTDAFGKVKFFGPDAVSALWVDFGFGRWYVQASDLASRIDALEAASAAIIAAAATVSGLDARTTALEGLPARLTADEGTIGSLSTQIGKSLGGVSYVTATASYPARPSTSQRVIWDGPDASKPPAGSSGPVDGDILVAY